MPVLRASETAHKTLKDLASQIGLPMQTVLERAIDSYSQMLILERLNADYAVLRNDPVAWEEELAERALWEQTLSDGLMPKDER